MRVGLRPWLRWLRTPKALVIMTLLVLSAVAAPAEGLGRVVLQIGAAVCGAVAVDLVVARLRRGAVDIPDGAAISGLIVALVLIAGAPPLVAFAAAAVAVASKHFLATAQVHLFNPAAVGLLIGLVVFPTGHSWWGALTDLPWPASAILIGCAVVVANRVRRLPMLIAFLLIYFAAFALMALPLSGSVPRLAEVFRIPFLNAAIFFSGFMLTDPVTSPSRPREQLWFAGVAAVASAITFMVEVGLWYLFIGLLSANAWWAWRRTVASAAAASGTRPGWAREPLGTSLPGEVET